MPEQSSKVDLSTTGCKRNDHSLCAVLLFLNGRHTSFRERRVFQTKTKKIERESGLRITSAALVKMVKRLSKDHLISKSDIPLEMKEEGDEKETHFRCLLFVPPTSSPLSFSPRHPSLRLKILFVL